MTSGPLLPRSLQFAAAGVLLAFLAWVVRLIRQERLSVRDSLLWLVSTGAALVLTLFPEGLRLLAHLAGVAVPSNALFALAILYLAVNALSLTLAVSAGAARTRRLAQECALLRAELERMRGEGKARPGPRGDAHP